MGGDVGVGRDGDSEDVWTSTERGDVVRLSRRVREGEVGEFEGRVKWVKAIQETYRRWVETGYKEDVWVINGRDGGGRREDLVFTGYEDEGGKRKGMVVGYGGLLKGGGEGEGGEGKIVYDPARGGGKEGEYVPIKEWRERGRDKEVERELEALAEMSRMDGGEVGIEVGSEGRNGGGTEGTWILTSGIPLWFEEYVNGKISGKGRRGGLGDIVTWASGLEGFTLMSSRVTARDEGMVEYRGYVRVGDVWEDTKGGGKPIQAEFRSWSGGASVGTQGGGASGDFALGHGSGVVSGERGEGRGWRRLTYDGGGAWGGWRDDGTEA
ncbi:hypothetical protein TrCOL_g1067 [Triparma columacea]|uniref:Uncharacterized protein n=1 Tax=Triparma columacea TaxID=722753 RepID=A0A9W7L581_9STRA|nr:hypothetical protein TrCOL_g1067 [Triparma columacea]